MPDQSSVEFESNLVFTLTEPMRAAVETTALMAAMPLLALAPRGDNHHVIVLPGFAADDGSTRMLRGYLDQQGYHGRPWEQGRNLGLRRMGGYDQLVARVIDIARESGRKVSLIGWSLGGVHARAVAKIVPDQVRQVITLGAPIGGPLERTAIWRIYESVNGNQVERRFKEKIVNANRIPPPVPTTAIYSKSDGVVPWQIAREHISNEAEHAQIENIEVYASHIGLGFNASVYYAIADRLSQPEGSWQPFAPQPWMRMGYGADE